MSHWDARKIRKALSQLRQLKLQPDENQNPYKVSYYAKVIGIDRIIAGRVFISIGHLIAIRVIIWAIVQVTEILEFPGVWQTIIVNIYTG